MDDRLRCLGGLRYSDMTVLEGSLLSHSTVFNSLLWLSGPGSRAAWYGGSGNTALYNVSRRRVVSQFRIVLNAQTRNLNVQPL